MSPLDVADRGMEDGDAGILEALEIGQAESSSGRVRQVVQFLEIQGEQAQHVDHGGFANQIDCGEMRRI